MSVNVSLDLTDRADRELGHVIVDSAPPANVQVDFPAQQHVLVDNLPATQPVSGAVSVTNFPAPVTAVTVSNLPVTQNVAGSVAVTNFPAPVADQQVHGTVNIGSSVNVGNFPATQPVSIAAPLDVIDRAPRLLGHVTVDNPVSTVAVSNLPATQPVSIAAPVAVTGAFFPATQPVSGSVDVTDRAARLVGHVQVDNLPATQPVSGSVSVSNLPATQPVSGTVAVSNLPATQPVSGSVAVSNFPATQPVTFSNPVRTPIMLSWERLAGVAAESALANFTNGTKAGVALVAASSYTVTAGKTLRITSINVSAVATANTLFNSRLRIRQAAAVTNASPIIWQAECGISSQQAATLQVTSEGFSIPDGLEIPAGQQITFTHLESSATGLVSLVIIGYEY